MRTALSLLYLPFNYQKKVKYYSLENMYINSIAYITYIRRRLELDKKTI